MQGAITCGVGGDSLDSVSVWLALTVVEEVMQLVHSVLMPMMHSADEGANEPRCIAGGDEHRGPEHAAAHGAISCSTTVSEYLRKMHSVVRVGAERRR
jgi:hypothetical protein